MVLGDAAVPVEAAHAVGAKSEPDVAVRPCRDPARTEVPRVGYVKLGDAAVGIHSCQFKSIGLGKPNVSIRPGRDLIGTTVGSGDLELGDGAVGIDCPTLLPTH